MARLSTDVRRITTEQVRRAATYGYTSVLLEGAVWVEVRRW